MHLTRITTVVAVALIGVSSLASAQTRGVRFGALAGASIATITDFAGDALDEGGAILKSKNRIGFQGGVFATIPVNGAFAIQPEVHYVQKGSKFDAGLSGGLGANAGLALELAYVDIPVLARFDLGSTKRIHPFVVGGPSFAVRTSCNVAVTSEGTKLKSACDDGSGTTGSDPVKKTDIGAQAGIGLVGSLLGRSASVQLRLSQSLTSIAKEEAVADQPGVSPKNRGISVIFGWSR